MWLNLVQKVEIPTSSWLKGGCVTNTEDSRNLFSVTIWMLSGISKNKEINDFQII